MLPVVWLVSCRQPPHAPYVRLSGDSPSIEGAPEARAHLVVFWASWCAPCRVETPELLALATDPPRGLAVVVFSLDEGMNQVRDFFDGNPPPSLSLRLDRGGEAARSFGVDAPPVSILAVDGRLVARFSGAREWDSVGMRGLLRKLMDELPRASPKRALLPRPSTRGQS